MWTAHTDAQWAMQTILIPELDFNDTEPHDQLTSSQQSMAGNALQEMNILSHKDLAQTSGPVTAGEMLCSQTVEAERMQQDDREENGRAACRTVPSGE